MSQLDKFSEALRPFICYEWPTKQNNADDKRTENLLGMGDLFEIKSSDVIDGVFLKKFNENLTNDYDKNYLGTRITNIFISHADEFLFSKNKDFVKINKNKKSKKSDFTITNKNGKFILDLKSTRVPTSYSFGKYRNNISEIENDPKEFIKLLYENQSNGVRYGFQNRLYVLYNSEISNSKCHLTEIKIRFVEKENIFKNFIKEISDINKIPYNGVNLNNGKEVTFYGILLIINENKNGELEYKIIENK